MCFLDIEKCFDTIDHDILLQKLKWYGIDGHELDWFKNYLYDRKQCVHVDIITSDVTSCPIGVPHGSVLGPILFLLYVNDFAQYIENQNCNIFADDAMIYSFGREVVVIFFIFQQNKYHNIHTCDSICCNETQQKHCNIIHHIIT